MAHRWRWQGRIARRERKKERETVREREERRIAVYYIVLERKGRAPVRTVKKKYTMKIEREKENNMSSVANDT